MVGRSFSYWVLFVDGDIASKTGAGAPAK